MASAPIPLEKPPVTDFYVLLGVSSVSGRALHRAKDRLLFASLVFILVPLSVLSTHDLCEISYFFCCLRISPPLPPLHCCVLLETKAAEAAAAVQAVPLLPFVVEFRESLSSWSSGRFRERQHSSTAIALRFARIYFGLVSCERASLVLVIRKVFYVLVPRCTKVEQQTDCR